MVTREVNLGEIRACVQSELQRVDDAVLAHLDSPVRLIPTVAQHLIHSGGKRLRPLLVLLVARAIHATALPEAVLTFAAIIEFIHTATLLHDDVVDDSTVRRGSETANAIWDNKASVLVGDFLLSRSFEMLVAIGYVPLMDWMAKATNRIASGEVMQLQFRQNIATTEADYLAIIEAKTAVLFGVAARGSAVLAGESDDRAAQWSEYGLSLGMAFQLIDDVLDYAADPGTLGKNLGDDLAEGKLTLPLIYALQHVTSEERALLEQAVVDAGTRDHLPEVVKIIERAGGIQYTYDLAARYCERARSALSVFTASPGRDALLRLVDFALARQF